METLADLKDLFVTFSKNTPAEHEAQLVHIFNEFDRIWKGDIMDLPKSLESEQIYSIGTIHSAHNVKPLLVTIV